MCILIFKIHGAMSFVAMLVFLCQLLHQIIAERIIVASQRGFDQYVNQANEQTVSGLISYIKQDVYNTSLKRGHSVNAFVLKKEVIFSENFLSFDALSKNTIR